MLTVEERTLLEWLVTTVDEHWSADESQVDKAKVVGHCECGCGSLYFKDHSAIEGSPSAEMIADCPGRTPDGHPVDVILWTRGGLLSYLEIVRYGDSGPGATPHPLWFEWTETSAV